jgi:hypothetical protein
VLVTAAARWRRLRRGLLVAIALASGSTTCVSGDFDDGQFRCDPARADAGQCPDGQGCGSDGLCRRAPCAEHFADCDGDAANGCETPLLTSVAHCGACANACATSSTDPLVCAEGACALDCPEGRGDCDGDLVNGCESDLTRDAESCGACGHGCLGGECEAARCQPFVLAEIEGGSTGGLALDVDTVYWALGAASTVVAVPKLGGAFTPLTIASNPSNVAVVGADVLYTESGDMLGRLVSVPASGMAPKATILADGLTSPGPVVVADGLAYVRTANTIEAIELATKKKSTQAIELPSSGGLATDGTLVFFGDASNGQIARLPGPAIVATGLDDPRVGATDAEFVYFVDPAANVVGRVAKLGAASAEVLASGLATPGAVAVDGDRAYFTQIAKDAPFGIGSVPLEGGAVAPVVTSLVPGALAGDDGALYFTVADAAAKVARLYAIAK